MGIIQHHAVVAVTGAEDTFEAVKLWIGELTKDEQQLFLTGVSWINGYYTVVMIPDGSKENWGASNDGNDLRAAFIGRIEADTHGDESSPWRWVEVGFGELGQSSRGAGTITRGKNEDLY